MLDECYTSVDYISLHAYFRNLTGDTPSFLASGYLLDKYITGVESVCDYIKAKKRSKKTMMLAMDEYNVWYHSKGEKYEKYI